MTLVNVLDVGGVCVITTLIHSRLYSEDPTCIVVPISQTSATQPLETTLRDQMEVNAFES